MFYIVVVYAATAAAVGLLVFLVVVDAAAATVPFRRQLSAPDESPLRDRPEEERVPLRLGALDKVSLEADEKTEIEREKQVKDGVVVVVPGRISS